MDLKLLCAAKGKGKTPFLCQYAARATDHGRSVGRVASPATFETGQRIGYDLADPRRSSRRTLARVVSAPEATPTLGMCQFDDPAINEENVVIDEVGPLEFRGKGWTPALEIALRECGPRWTAAQRVLPPWPL